VILEKLYPEIPNENCPNDIYEVMLMCWKYNPEDRPSFRKIFEILKSNHNIIQGPSIVLLDYQEVLIENFNITYDFENKTYKRCTHISTVYQNDNPHIIYE